MSPTLHDLRLRSFASDNYSGAHPDVMAALVAANGGHQVAYGEDVYTERLQEVLAAHFARPVEAYPVFNGTGANVVGLQALLPRWGAVVCAQTAHIHCDENGAPERMGGMKLLPVPTPDGKLTPELIATEAWGWGDEHRAQPLAVSITQSTELGTVYRPDEIAAICDWAHEHHMMVHLDGARISNAAASLDLPLAAFTSDVGVDAISLGGTKNGLVFGEAVVILDSERITGLPYLRKMSMQLPSKMRFVSAQLIALWEGSLWRDNASHANAMAARLAAGLDGLDGVQVTQRVEANAVFVVIEDHVADKLREAFRFYDWDAARHERRWMCSFDTTESDVDGLLTALRDCLDA